ncbi:MAG: FHA domain-containing protein [Myxococcales bacterium]|nr:FHA domain-containing protein [Myxococcales bacterium]
MWGRARRLLRLGSHNGCNGWWGRGCRVSAWRVSLHFLSGDRQGDELVLEDPSKLVVGRGAEADLVLSAGMVSRCHALLRLTDGVLEVDDLGSSNGTLVNGESVVTRRLEAGDRLLIGANICEIVVSRVADLE